MPLWFFCFVLVSFLSSLFFFVFCLRVDSSIFDVLLGFACRCVFPILLFPHTQRERPHNLRPQIPFYKRGSSSRAPTQAAPDEPCVCVFFLGAGEESGDKF